MDTAKPRNLALPIAVAVLVLLLAVAFVVLTFEDRWTRHQLRGIQQKMASYLLANDHRWPQPPGSASFHTAPPDWWTTDKKQLSSGAYQIAKFDDTPNMAFYDSKKPWLIYTSWNGRRYELLPNGTISVTKPH